MNKWTSSLKRQITPIVRVVLFCNQINKIDTKPSAFYNAARIILFFCLFIKNDTNVKDRRVLLLFFFFYSW